MNKSVIDEIRKKYRKDGGEGSGNWGHKGRPGKVGGSQENEGSAKWFRYKDAKHGNYSSLAKEKGKAQKPHHVGKDELTRLPSNSLIISKDGVYEKDGESWKNKVTGISIGKKELQSKIDNEDCRVAIPGGPAAYDKTQNTYIGGHVNSKGSMIGSHHAGEGKSENVQFSAAQVQPSEESKPSGKSASSSSSESSSGTSSSSSESSSVFDPSGYSKERVASAKKLNSEDECKLEFEDHYDMLKSYKNSKNTKDKSMFNSLWRYTAGSHYISEPLHSQQYYGGKHGTAATTKDINNLTKLIDKNEIPNDIMVAHALGGGGFRSMFNLPTFFSDSDLDNIVGYVGTDTGFCSCTAYGKDFGKGYVLDIFVPKGSKGLYVGRYSYYGEEGGHPTNERELILQRGGSYKVTGWDKDSGGRYHLKCELVGQDTSTVTAEDWEKYTN